MMFTYSVRTWGGSSYKVQAENSTKAKKIVCKMLGRSISAPLIGMRGMTAKKVEERDGQKERLKWMN